MKTDLDRGKRWALMGGISLLAALGTGAKVEDISAFLGIVVWLLAGLVVVKILAIIGGVS